MKRLAIITTHPIQYYAPIFKLLSERQNIAVNVFYTWGDAALKKYDPGFGKQVDWDIPLLDGYPYQWVQNTAKDAGSHHFKGIVNPDLVKQIEDWNADTVLVFGWAYKSNLQVLRHFKNKIPVLFRGDSTLLDTQPGFKNLLRSFFLKWVYSHVDYALYPGTNNKAYFKKYGLKENQLKFAPHAVDNNRFSTPDATSANTLRAQLNIKEHELLILFAGKFEDKKDPVLFLNGFLTLGNELCHLLFVGNGILEQQLKEKAAGNERIHFMGFQNQTEMPVVYQACDLFVLPSKGPNETWGLAVNEAMAAGKAILVSDKVGCAADLVKSDENGLIFEAKQEDSLTRALTKLTQSKALLKSYGERSASIIKDWNFVNIVQQIEKLVLNEPD